MKLEKVLLYRNYAVFLRLAKSFGKNLKQIFHWFPSETSAFNSKCEKSYKSCNDRAEKSIFACTIFINWTHKCMHRLITRYDAVFYPRICTEFLSEHGTSLFYVNGVYIVYIVWLPLFIGEVEIFWKIIEEGRDQDILVKMGGSPFRVDFLCNGRRGKRCFSLLMYGFCSSNALYSPSL